MKLYDCESRCVAFTFILFNALYMCYFLQFLCSPLWFRFSILFLFTIVFITSRFVWVCSLYLACFVIRSSAMNWIHFSAPANFNVNNINGFLCVLLLLEAGWMSSFVRSLSFASIKLSCESCSALWMGIECLFSKCGKQRRRRRRRAEPKDLCVCIHALCSKYNKSARSGDDKIASFHVYCVVR